MEETSVWRAYAMEIPPLSERPVSQEEEEAFLRSIQPRRGLFGRRFIGPRRWRPGWAWRVRGGGGGDAARLAGGGRNGAGVVARRRFVCPMARRRKRDDDGRGGVGV